MAKKKSLTEAASKELKSKFDLNAFKDKKGLKQNVKFKEQEWIPLSSAFQDVTSIPGIPSSSPATFGVKGLGQSGTTFSGGASGSGNAGGIGYKQTPGGASAPGGTGGGAFTDTRMVRVPRHMLGLNTYYKIPNKKISFNLQTIGATDARDYGNFNSPLSGTDYADVKLPAYFVNHLTMNYDYIPGYDVFCKITNLTSEDYHSVLHYSQPQRAFNCGMKKSFD